MIQELKSKVSSSARPTHSVNWQNIISAPLEEDLVPLFLTNISPFLDHHFLPAPKHVQLLLYLTIHPPPHIIAHSPISLLYKLLSLHIPAAFAHCIPTIPTSAKANEHPRWLNWEANGRMEEEARKTLRRCREEGVWGLVSVHEKAGKKKEEEEEEGTERIVGEKGWEVLEWLVAVWEADQAGFEKDNTGQKHSPMFLQQLPRPYSSPDLQLDDATLPLAIIISALRNPTSVPAVEARRRQDVALRILVLMINVALPASPAFHPSSLILSLLTLIRTLPLSALILLIPGVTPRVPWNFSAHLHTMIIEDLAGIRSKKAEERKCKARKKRKLHTGSTNAEEGIGDLQEGFGAFSPPTVGYTCDLLAMSCSKGGGGAKMVFSKLSLLSIMLAKTASTDSAWSKVCERWEKRIGDSLDVSSGVDVDERQEFEGMKSAVHELVGFISRSRMT